MATRKHAIYVHLDRPPRDAAGQACYLTGNGSSGVDTGAHIFNEGTLFISDTALRELCEVAGFSFTTEGAALEVENAHLTHEVERLTAERDAAVADLDAFSVVFARGQAAAKASKS
jgi:hypothetical protein